MKSIIIILLISFTFSLKKIGPDSLQKLLKDPKTFVIDTRNLSIAEKGYIPKSLLLPPEYLKTYINKLIPKKYALVIISDKSNYYKTIKEIQSFGYKIFGFSFYEDWVKAKYKSNVISYDKISVEKINDIKKSNEVILDVREKNEYKETGIIKDSQLVSLSTFTPKMSKVEKNRTVHILCKGGKRAVFALTYLEKFGYNNKLKVLEGGMNKVIQVKYPLEKY